MEDRRKGIAPGQRTSAIHTVEAAKKVRGLVREMYTRAQQAVMQGKPVAWYMISYINPIFMAMDVVPIMPENWAGLCAAKRAGDPYILRAEAEGYSNVTCSYSRTGLGYCSMMRRGDVPSDVPDGGMARPTMLIGSSFVCDCRYKWFQSIGRYLDVPYYAFDMLNPPAETQLRRDVRDQYLKYLVEQYRGLVRFMEKVTGRRMDWDRLDKYVDIALETWRVWRTAYEFRKAVPCPMGTEDAENVFVPGFLQEGEQSVLDFYNDLHAELKYRAENGIGVIANEKYRLIWGPGLPPWHTMSVFNHFGKLGAVFVYEMMYEVPDIGDIPNVSDPLERMAWRQYLWYVQRNKRSVVGGYNFLTGGNPLEYIYPFKANGVVFHWLKSCRSTTIGQLYYRNLIREHIGVPCLMLESDMCDVRDYIETEWKGKINAFLDTVEVDKEARQQRP